MNRVLFAMLVLLAGLVHFGCGGEQPKKTAGGDGEKQDAAAEPAVSPEIAAEMKKPFKRLAFQDYNSDKNGVSDEFDWTGIVIDAPEGAKVEVTPGRFDVLKDKAYRVAVWRNLIDVADTTEKIRKDEENAGMIIDEDGRLAWTVKKSSGKTELLFLIVKKIKDDTFVITNQSVIPRAKTREQLDWMMKSADTFRLEGGEPAKK